jgi:hypothetical protein
MTGHLLEEVVLPIRGPVLEPYVGWLRSWPAAVSVGDGVTITFAAGSVPDSRLAWLVSDPSVWSDGKVPVQPAGSGPAPSAFYRSGRTRWWDGILAERFVVKRMPNGDAREPVDIYGRSSSSASHGAFARLRQIQGLGRGAARRGL